MLETHMQAPAPRQAPPAGRQPRADAGNVRGDHIQIAPPPISRERGRWGCSCSVLTPASSAKQVSFFPTVIHSIDNFIRSIIWETGGSERVNSSTDQCSETRPSASPDPSEARCLMSQGVPQAASSHANSSQQEGMAAQALVPLYRRKHSPSAVVPCSLLGPKEARARATMGPASGEKLICTTKWLKAHEHEPRLPQRKFAARCALVGSSGWDTACCPCCQPICCQNVTPATTSVGSELYTEAKLERCCIDACSCQAGAQGATQGAARAA